jgi:dephospho-CoA kinase
VPRPVAVAITGGIGAGKTEALKAFAHHGAMTLSADDVVHRLYDDEAVRAALRGRFGGKVFREDGSVDRKALAARVFSKAADLEWLEALLHPLVIRAQGGWRDSLAGLPDPPVLAVVEVPLLYETGGEDRFDAVVVLTAPQDVRVARSEAAVAEREQRLLPDEEKVQRADYAYVNDGTLEELAAFVARVVEELARRP